jgi:hypothetical protein
VGRKQTAAGRFLTSNSYLLINACLRNAFRQQSDLFQMLRN